MEKFNNTSIFTGYLKQLLHSYNLPKYKIYTKEYEKWHMNYMRGKAGYTTPEHPNIFKTIIKGDDPNIIFYVPYIKEGTIQEYLDKDGDGKYEWVEVGLRNRFSEHVHNYYEGMKALNYTKNLEIRNNIYDSYTHEYLGDYLRFQRDYNDIDLMPLYNCFSNRTCDHLDYSFEKFDKADGGTEIPFTIKFNSSDASYKIYMLPVKLFKEYTIAIDSEKPIELCCGLYGEYQDTRDQFKDIPNLTYKKLRRPYFAQPIIYSEIKNLINQPDNIKNELAQNEDNLKLFIKVPLENKSSIVVLEGDYRNWTDFKSDCKVAHTNKVTKKPAKFQNNTVVNFEYMSQDFELELRTPLQLLRFNTGEHYPFSDRLIEYLTENVISPIDTISQNIARAQKVIQESTLRTNNGIDERTGKDIYSYTYEPLASGFWDNQIRYIIYDYKNNHNNVFEASYDNLGYIDKDAEKYNYYNDRTGTYVSIADAMLDEEDN